MPAPRGSPISNASDGSDLSALLTRQVLAAARDRRPLRIVGGGTKAWYGRRVAGEPLDVGGHRGVIAYDPCELVITARAGTPIGAIEAVLADNGQMLGFEPPRFGPASTVGGAIASGLAGPRRPFSGAPRDFLLGATVLDGRGRTLRFGGTVFKNVAGFDAFRPMAGALGCLGVLLDVSLRVTPTPRAELSSSFEGDRPRSAAMLDGLMRRPLPLSGAFYDGERLHLRFSGARAAVAAAARELGGEPTPANFWSGVRDITLPGLDAPRLWRLSLPRRAPALDLGGPCLHDWAGAQRWAITGAGAADIRAAARNADGHATLFRGAEPGEDVFEPLPAPLMALHKRIKAVFDPAGVLNPGRMYEDL
ncbi:MAG: glycolate oxidase subunit GlcE [Caulobacteraceae bacterium]